MCPYERQYELIGLSEFWPDRFQFACDLEQKLCHKPELTWIYGYRLPELLERADEIKERRAKWIVRKLRESQVQYLFEVNEPIDQLAISSCGLLCGK